MDSRMLITLVSQCPPLWDRNHEKFRDQEFKSTLWEQVGLKLNSSGSACRESFKTLREKYVREREKVQQYGAGYRTWDLFEIMQFLEPHIITRKQSCQLFQDECTTLIKQDPNTNNSEDRLSESDISNSYVNGYNNLADAESCKTLIKMVYEMKPLWDRQTSTPKPNRDHLWKIIAATLNSKPNICALRWKGLREKYIRQKQRYIEGEAKWELLDNLSFLDSVIQYRKKSSLIDESSVLPMCESQMESGQSNLDNELSDDRTNDSCPNFPSSSTSSCYQQVITNNSLFNSGQAKPHTPDSTIDPATLNFRKRTLSEASETLENFKRHKPVESEKTKTPEEIFGQFVSAMLTIKEEREKSVAMMEIMSILTKR